MMSAFSGCMTVRVRPGTLGDYSSGMEMDKDSFDRKTAGILAKGGEVIAVLFKKKIIGAYFFERENDSLRLAGKCLVSTDIDTGARIEGLIRRRMRRIMLSSAFGKSPPTNRTYFYDEVIMRDCISPIF